MGSKHYAERNLKLLNILTFTQGFRTYEGVFVVYVATVSGSFAMGMTVFAILNISAAIFEVPTGLLSDAIGRKKTVLLYYLAGVLATATFYFADSSVALVFAAIISGFAMAMRSGAVSAYVYENLEVLGRLHEFKKYEGGRMALGRYALVVAGLLGTIIMYFADIRSAILLTLVVTTATFFISFLLTDLKKFEPRKANIYADLTQAWDGFVHDPALRNLSLGKIFYRGIGNVEYRFRSLFFSAIMPPWLVNLLGILHNLISGISMQFAHWFVERFGFMRSLVHFYLVDRMFVLIFVVMNSVVSGFLIGVLAAIGFGLREVASEDLQQSRYSKEQRATMGSLVGLGGSVVYGICAVIVGILADTVGLFTTMLLLQPALMLVTYFFYRGVKLGNH